MSCEEQGGSYGIPRAVVFKCSQCGTERTFRVNPYSGEIEYEDRGYYRYHDGAEPAAPAATDYVSQDQSPRDNAYGGIRGYFGGTHYKTWLVIPLVFVCVILSLASVFVHPALPVLFATIGFLAIPKAIRHSTDHSLTQVKAPEKVYSRPRSYISKALVRAFCAMIVIVLCYSIIVGRVRMVIFNPEELILLLAASVLVAAISNTTAILVSGMLLLISGLPPLTGSTC